MQHIGDDLHRLALIIHPGDGAGGPKRPQLVEDVSHLRQDGRGGQSAQAPLEAAETGAVKEIRAHPGLAEPPGQGDAHAGHGPPLRQRHAAFPAVPCIAPHEIVPGHHSRVVEDLAGQVALDHPEIQEGGVMQAKGDVPPHGHVEQGDGAGFVDGKQPVPALAHSGLGLVGLAERQSALTGTVEAHL